ncbi:branched-chain amino acid ABC transporter ATP-binding protein/permease [Pseudomonas chengduensis]|jgi:branched-chain amino acid transport system permease protein|uniref:Branched-chain amino acid ABC transporter ATP-binding protein/permease n=1 Tax=Ectopseudomonas toyotomiensis TaxID=554344 RepID=A0AA42IQD6_9GAMM|nr:MULTISPECIES: branched-chain amino acid ABC transporter ATP-binding protein/permease [Pseudomonas]MBG0842342.1 branched-chain amino acid ABC transporter ATP-binding protein/permease [Pseudomonas toyotomiensis]MDH0703558.1 branched-chain amino acid ABC transporter ATP-binding protein/permease [Pseudomonas toyotomiensis]MDH1681838.1 branched-chain amino acid ABC transporter ATP-binding protein/permease [Pseudomonas chengduensis]
MNRRLLALLLLLVGVVLAPQVLQPFHVTLLNYVGLYSLVALGLVVLTGVGGLTSFGQAAFVGIGAYATAVVSANLGLSPWLGLLVGLGITLVVALLLGLLTLRLAGHYLPLGTLAWGLALYYLFGNLPMLGGFAGIADLPYIQLGGWTIDSASDFTLIIGVLLVATLWMLGNLLDSRQGRAIRSLKEASGMAEAMGVNTMRSKLLAFVLAALLAALSGWIYAHMQRIVNPTPFSVTMGIEYLFMIVLGGAASLWGALVGAALLTLFKQVLEDVLPQLLGSGGGTLELIVFGVLIILVLQYAKDGLLPLLQKYLPSPKPRELDLHDAEPLPRRETEPLPSNQPLLAAEGLVKRFGGLVANNDMSLSVQAGQVVALIGPNGAGKSTLFNLLTGVLPPTSGQVFFKGQRIDGMSPRAIASLGVSRTFQHVRLLPGMSVLENVALGAHRRGRAGVLSSLLHLERGEERRLLAEAKRQIERVGLADYLHTPAGSLALGQQRIVEIARALCSDPQMLLLDEPAAGLRYNEKQTLACLLEQLREEGLGVLLVEHDMDFVMGLADHIVVMEFGQRLATGSPMEIQDNPAVLAAYLGGVE